jgi:hypothetical protein
LRGEIEQQRENEWGRDILGRRRRRRKREDVIDPCGEGARGKMMTTSFAVGDYNISHQLYYVDQWSVGESKYE